MKDTCKILKYLIDNNAYPFINMDSFLIELGKQKNEIRGLLIWLNDNGLVQFEGNEYRRITATKWGGVSRWPGEFTVNARLTDKSEKYFKEHCMEETNKPTQQYNIGKVDNLNTGPNYGEFTQTSEDRSRNNTETTNDNRQPTEIPKKNISIAEWIMIVLAVVAIIVTIIYSN